jgi:hypothetical protein
MKKRILLGIFIATVTIPTDAAACETKALNKKPCAAKTTSVLTKLARQAVQAYSIKSDVQYYDFLVGNSLLRF